MPSFLSGWGWLAVIPVLGLLVFVHELGHFLAARWMKVQVEEFGFGYPPRLATLFERDGVKYTINLLPLGGFVRMVGEEGDFDTEGSLYQKQPWQRAIVLAAGPAMNLVLAAAVLALVLWLGAPKPHGSVVVLEVAPDSPAAQAGLQAGDMIRAIGGEVTDSTEAVVEATSKYLGQPTEVVIERNGDTFTRTVLFRRPQDRPRDQGAMGVVIELQSVESITYERVSIPVALTQGLLRTAQLFLLMLIGLGDLVLRLLSGTQVPGGVAGPIGIAQLSGEAAQQGIRTLLNFTGFLSVNLALLNLLPLPALDGGRLVFVIVEWIRGKRIPPEREAVVHFIGMVVLIGLMAVVSYFDLARWLSGQPLLGGG
ncbi:MAG: RIP metalloprotease RseP, partial [Anaerolineae bacterium]